MTKKKMGVYSPISTDEIIDGWSGGEDTPITTIPSLTTPTVSVKPKEEVEVVAEAEEEVEVIAEAEEEVAPSSTCAARTGISGFDPNAAPLPQVGEAPAYEISPEQQAWAQMHGGEIQSIIEQGGVGLSEEIQSLMIDKNNEALMTREAEAIRLMKNNMARRGIENWGLEFKNIQQIKSTTTKDIAANIRDIRIQNALMKASSFENALGISAHFLSYLDQQSQLINAPKQATWHMKEQAKLLQYQANVDIWKMKINQAYTCANMQHAQELAEQGMAQQHQYNIEIEQMKIDAAEKAASTGGFWQTVGTVIGFFASFLNPFKWF